MIRSRTLAFVALALLTASMNVRAQEGATSPSCEAFKKVEAFLRTGKPTVMKTTGRGPGGKIKLFGGSPSPVCGSSHTVGEVADQGVFIPTNAEIGTGDTSDTKEYGYVLHTIVTDPSDTQVSEIGNFQKTKNVQFSPEFANILRYRACPSPGTYTVEFNLFVIDPDTSKVNLLDRKRCTFSVIAPVTVVSIKDVDDSVAASDLPAEAKASRTLESWLGRVVYFSTSDTRITFMVRDMQQGIGKMFYFDLSSAAAQSHADLLMTAITTKADVLVRTDPKTSKSLVRNLELYPKL